jgi:dsDNA-specific endonuclease/ATPase MutS2
MLLPLDKYPKLDVHGETRDTVYTVVKNFINDNIKLKNEIIIIVHGKGSGILKDEIHYELKKMKEVRAFHLDYWNQGVTIVELNLTSTK